VGKRLEAKYEKIADDEIEKMRDHYRQLSIALEGQVQRRRPLEELIVERGYAQSGNNQKESDETSEPYTPEEQAAIDEVNAQFPEEEEDDEEDEDPEPIRVVPEQQVTNVFTSRVGEWDYAVEVKSRKRDLPYIIHIDEFRQNELEHEQVTYTYYEVDDVLSDERNTTIDDIHEVIGLHNLGRWGHGSEDENIVYVRNELLHLDAEVIRDPSLIRYKTQFGTQLNSPSSVDIPIV
jgi:hypothetical protein